MKNKNINKLEKASKTITSILKSSKMKAPSEFHFRLANYYFNNQRYSEAEKHLQEALNLDKNDSNYLYRLAIIKEKLGKPKDAIKILNKTIKLAPESIDAITAKGRLEYRLGQYKKAINTLLNNKIMRKKRPLNCPIVYYYIGLNYKKLNKHKKAIAYFDLALKNGSRNFRIWVDRGLSLMDLKRYRNALDSFNKAYYLNKNSIFPILFTISSLYHLDKWRLALQWIRRGDNISPNNPSLLSMKGYYFLKDNRPKLSIKYYEKLLKIDRSRVNAIYNLACAYSRMHRDDLALKMLGRAIRSDLKYKSIAKNDEDFRQLQNNKRFLSLIRK